MEDSWLGFGEMKEFTFFDTVHSYTYFKDHFNDTVSGNAIHSPFTNYFIEDEI